jgi:hypothetical protein
MHFCIRKVVFAHDPFKISWTFFTARETCSFQLINQSCLTVSFLYSISASIYVYNHIYFLYLKGCYKEIFSSLGLLNFFYYKRCSCKKSTHILTNICSTLLPLYLLCMVTMQQSCTHTDDMHASERVRMCEVCVMCNNWRWPRNCTHTLSLFVCLWCTLWGVGGGGGGRARKQMQLMVSGEGVKGDFSCSPPPPPRDQHSQFLPPFPTVWRVQCPESSYILNTNIYVCLYVCHLYASIVYSFTHSVFLPNYLMFISCTTFFYIK